MIKYVFEYDDASEVIIKAFLFDQTSPPSVTPDSGHSLLTFELDGEETDSELADLASANGQPDWHKVISASLKRLVMYYPDALTASAGFTPAAALADFQEGGSQATATNNNTDTSCHVTFPTPTMTPETGANEQTITVEVGQFDTGQTGTPTVRIEVWENGGGAALVASAELDVDTASETHDVTWNANLLGTADGSKVEVKVFGTKSGGGAGAKNSVNIGPIYWKALQTTNV